MRQTLLHSPRGVNHLAFPCWDIEATMQFYSGLLGLELVFAHSGVSEEWGGHAYLMASFALRGGQQITFFELDGAKRPPADGLPQDIRHFALEVSSEAQIAAWRQRLEQRGISFWSEDHGGQVSLYIPDPNGAVVELTPAANEGGDKDSAAGVVRRWVARKRRTQVRGRREQERGVSKRRSQAPATRRKKATSSRLRRFAPACLDAQWPGRSMRGGGSGRSTRSGRGGTSGRSRLGRSGG